MHKEPSETPRRALDTKAAAVYVGVQPKTLANLRAPSSPMDGPVYRLIGAKPVYLVEDLDRWLEQQPQRRRNPARGPAVSPSPVAAA